MLRAGLAGAAFVTVDDTGARHAGKGCFTTHIGSGPVRRVPHRAGQVASGFPLADCSAAQRAM